MRIVSFTYFDLQLPLRLTFAQANNKGTRRSSSIVVKLVTTEGVAGYGEACPRPYVTGESIQSVRKDLNRFGVKIQALQVHTTRALDRVLNTWIKEGMGPSTRCAIELAWLDAWSKTKQLPLTKLLGASPVEELSYSLVLPLLPPAKFARLLEKIPMLRPQSIKLKVDNHPINNRIRLEMIRHRFHSQTNIRVDVNGGWTKEDAQHLIPKLFDLGITSFEQPLPVGQEAATAGLTKEFGHAVQIMADESLLTLSQAKQYIEDGVFNHFNLKISKLGGLLPTWEMYQLATVNDIPCQLGAHFGETSILSAAGALFGAICPMLSGREGALGEYLLEKDPVKPCLQQKRNGNLRVENLYHQPGLIQEFSGEFVIAV